MNASSVTSAIPDATNTVAVVTTFHPEPGLSSRLGALEGQVAKVIVVDNGSVPGEMEEVVALERSQRLEVLRNGRNEGLAKALNQGVALAAERGGSWVLLLDQDSTPLPGLVAYVGRIVAAYERRVVALVGTALVGPHHAPGGSRGVGWAEVPIVITSGTILAVPVWRELGGFREDFFVDYVDIEFSLRARAHGYAVLESLSPLIRHEIGQPTRHRILSRAVTVTNHAAWRRRGITANRVVVWRTYLRAEPGYVLRDAIGFAKELAKVVLFETDRWQKIAAIEKGLIAGIRDRSPRRGRPHGA